MQQQCAHSDATPFTPLLERFRQLSRGQPVRRLGRLLVRPLGFGGLMFAVVFFWISLTPSLLPRTWLFQGVVSGLSAVAGYGIGSSIAALVRLLTRADPAPALRRYNWMALTVTAVLGSGVLLWHSQRWQNELRALVGLGEASGVNGLGVLLVTAIVAGVLLAGARLVRAVAQRLINEIDRIAPRWLAIVVGMVLAAGLAVEVLQGIVWRGVVGAMNRTASIANGTTSVGTRQPGETERSGSPESLVLWDTLGRQGRDFVGLGPTTRDLEAFHGAGCCPQPIRVN